MTSYRLRRSGRYGRPVDCILSDSCSSRKRRRVTRRGVGDRLLATECVQGNPVRLGWEAEIDGIRCEIYRRIDGLDAIFVAVKHGFVVCQREIRDKSGRLLEAVHNTKLKNIHPGVWFPMLQVQSAITPSRHREWTFRKPICTLKILTTRISIGNVEERLLHIEIPKGATVDDQIRGVRYRKAASGSISLEHGIKEGKYELARASGHRRATGPHTTTVVFGCLFCLFSAFTVVLVYQRFCKQSTRNG